MLRGHKTSCNEKENVYRTEQNISLIWYIKGTILVLLEVTDLRVYLYHLPHISSSLAAGPAYPFFLFADAAVAGLFLSLALAAAVPPSSQH